MKLNCIIVDDEPLAQDVLDTYISRIDALHLAARCKNAFEAMNVLHKKKIDIMFLDIKMPTLSGLDMLKTIDHPPKVILTTAFSEFGAESYEFGVIDYLLKPIAFKRFLKAVNKILIPARASAPVETPAEKSAAPEMIFFKAEKKIHKYFFADILYFQGSGNYVKVVSKTRKAILVLDKMSDLMEKLPAGLFMRVHKSYIVNINHIKQLQGNMVKVGEDEVPLGQSYKEEFMKRLGGI